MNHCTKVTVRSKAISQGKRTVYLDFYPPIRNPKTGKSTRREFLGIYIYDKPNKPFERQFNKTMLENAEVIRCRRQESVISQEFGFLDRSSGKESFLDYWDQNIKGKSNCQAWRNSLNHFIDYCNNKCCFDDLNIDFCQGFLEYMMTEVVTHTGGYMMASTANNNFDYLKNMIKSAYAEGYIKVDFTSKLVRAKEAATQHVHLTPDEVAKLKATPCKKDVVKRASLFSCYTGLRISDVLNLKWENIVKRPDGMWGLNITTIKTGTEASLPISDETLSFCGERGTGTVFVGLSKGIVREYLQDWVDAAGIEKHITFHCFRHTYATNLLTAGIPMTTISKMLTHSNITVTSIYADVVDESKCEAAKVITDLFKS